RTSIHLERRQSEAVDPVLEAFYRRLEACLLRRAFREGDWQLQSILPAWDGNLTDQKFIAFSWEGGGERILVTVNYGATQGQCYVGLHWPDLRGRTFLFQ